MNDNGTWMDNRFVKGNVAWVWSDRYGIPSEIEVYYIDREYSEIYVFGNNPVIMGVFRYDKVFESYDECYRAIVGKVG